MRYDKETQAFIDKMKKDPLFPSEGLTDEQILEQSRFFCSGGLEVDRSESEEWDDVDEIEEI